MAGPITWRSIAAPDATGAAQILQQAGQNIGRGVDAFKNIADNQVATITDQNVSSLAQQIMSVNKGVDGFDQLDQVQSQLQSVNAADIGGTKGLEALMDMAKGKRTELETEATGSFNEMLAQARSTGDFTGINAAKEGIASKLTNAAPLLEAARSAEYSYKANSLISGINSGELDPAEVLNNKELDFSQPEMREALNVIGRAATNEKIGGLITNIQSHIEDVTKKGVSLADKQKAIYAAFKNPKEIAENYGAISGIMSQITNAYVKAQDLNPYEQRIVQTMDNKVQFEQQQLENKIAARRNELTPEAKLSVAAVEAADGLNLIGVVNKVLGDTAFDKNIPIFGETRQEAALEKIQKVLAKNPDITPAAIIYAAQTYGELGDTYWSNEKSFIEMTKAAQAKLNENKAEWNEFRQYEINERAAFNDYFTKANMRIAQEASLMPRQRMQGNEYTPGVVESYEEWKTNNSRDVASLLRASKKTTKNNVETVTPTRQTRGQRLLSGLSTGLSYSSPVGVASQAAQKLQNYLNEVPED